ncbi:MAG: hypothetical protein LBD85_00585 [Oscillospiraceae bacterium]|jgi:hypothetical protein|nr:hypothetical protein [Oscillospiraceae bacterium]
MKQFSKKRLTSLILAVMMTVSTIALSAYANGGLSAETPEVGWAPGENAQFWYTDPELDVQYPQTLAIESTPYNFTLGNNTIQEYFYDSDNDNFVASLHPQYFGTAVPIDYDDQDDAYYIMNITSILVYNSKAAQHSYVECLSRGVAVIPRAYALPSLTSPRYFQCMVFATITDIRTGVQFDADWNGKVIYLEIPGAL